MIPCNYLPSSLWQDAVLHAPSDIHDVYRAKLNELNLLERAIAYDGRSGAHGGESENDTHEHFLRRYLNSVARVQCVMLDPHRVFDGIPRDLLLTLSSHRISLLDVPCGTGAGGIATLVTLKELRMAGVLPMMPLNVEILGADVSEHALKIYQSQLEQLKEGLARAGIIVSLETRKWDAKDVQQTNKMIDDYLWRKDTQTEFLVLVANFSGASQKGFPEFQDSFRQIWIRLSGGISEFSTILWVEPKSRDATPTLFKNLLKLVERYKWFQRLAGKRQNYHECDFQFYDHLNDKMVESGVMVHYYSRKDVS